MNEKDSAAISWRGNRSLEFVEAGLGYMADWIMATDSEFEAQGMLPLNDTAKYKFLPRAVPGQGLHIIAYRSEQMPDDEPLVRSVEFILVQDGGDYELLSDIDKDVGGIRTYSINKSIEQITAQVPDFLDQLEAAGRYHSSVSN